MEDVRVSGAVSKRPTPEERFWRNVNKSGPTMPGMDSACWEWTAHRRGLGYGEMWVNGRNVVTHRFSFALANGPIPAGLFVCHRCDNPPCVNPDHLFLGTHDDNMADRSAKGRQAKGDRQGARLHPETVVRGEAHHSAKLSEADVLAIRARSLSGETMLKLSKEYRVDHATVRRIVTGHTWKHLPANIAPDGLRRYTTKLTEADVREIRRLYALGGQTIFQLGERFGVSFSSISRIILRKNWAHVKDEDAA